MSFPTVLFRAIKSQRSMYSSVITTDIVSACKLMADPSSLCAVRDFCTTCHCQTPCKAGGPPLSSSAIAVEKTKPRGAGIGMRSRTRSMPDITPKLRGATNEMMRYLQNDSTWEQQEGKGLNLLDKTDRPVHRVKSDNTGVNRREVSWDVMKTRRPPEGKLRPATRISSSWEEKAKGKRVSIGINRALNWVQRLTGL